MNIGSYQLRNLLANRVKFQYFDLRRDSPSPGHPLLGGSQRISSDALEDFLVQSATPPDAAIVLICADGLVSRSVGDRLEAKSYINVFVVEGGVAALG